jgi:type II secretory pathway pseudopilin PulG
VATNHYRLFRRRGISLLEVLMTIFIIAVGLASVFALFLAGREIEVRAIRKTDAQAFSQAVAQPLVNDWCDASQWLYLDPNNAEFRWVRPSPLPSLTPIGLPILVDPWGLATADVDEGDWAGTPLDETIGNNNQTTNWGLNRFLPFSGTPLPFARVTLPSFPRGADSSISPPLTREQVLSSLAGPDAIEFSNTSDDASPPTPLFELGRRKRGSDFIPALFICQNNAGNNEISSAVVQRWLLIFHKPAAAYQQKDDGSTWPMGVHQLENAGQSSADLLEVIPTRFTSADNTDVLRAFQPGKWVLVTHRRGGGVVFDAHFTKLISATQEGTKWLLAIEPELPANWSFNNPVNVYAFESLVDVRLDSSAPLTGL